MTLDCSHVLQMGDDYHLGGLIHVLRRALTGSDSLSQQAILILAFISLTAGMRLSVEKQFYVPASDTIQHEYIAFDQ